MRTSGKFLNVIMAAAGSLVLLAVIVFGLRDNLPAYTNENTPFGVVNDFLTAILREDYPKAYTFLAEWPEKPAFTQFEQRVHGLNGYQYCIEISDYPAPYPGYTVIQIYTYNCQGERWQINWDTIKPEVNPNTTPNDAELVQVNGEWKIRRMPLPWWQENWFSQQMQEN